MEKLKKAEFLSGANISSDKRLLEKFEKELKTEFIPELYDKSMDKVFDDKYYDNVEGKKEKKKMKKLKQLDLKLLKDQFDQVDKDEGGEEEDQKSEDSEEMREIYERELTKSLKAQVQKQEQEEEDNEWFVCDNCTKPIQAGKARFDCQQCDNYTFCEKCYKKNKTHLHRFTKQFVPLNCGPPQNH